MMTLKESELVIKPEGDLLTRKPIREPICSLLLVGDQPHDSPVFGEHLRPDQDPEDGEDLQEEVLKDAGEELSGQRWSEEAGGQRSGSHPQAVLAEGLQQLLVVPVAHLTQQRQQTRHKLPLTANTGQLSSATFEPDNTHLTRFEPDQES